MRSIHALTVALILAAAGTVHAADAAATAPAAAPVAAPVAADAAASAAAEAPAVATAAAPAASAVWHQVCHREIPLGSQIAKTVCHNVDQNGNYQDSRLDELRRAQGMSSGGTGK